MIPLTGIELSFLWLLHFAIIGGGTVMALALVILLVGFSIITLILAVKPGARK